jgi:hypothetical protein
MERAMKPAAQRMIAELLGRQLGVDAGELAGALDGDPMTAIFTLSMMSQSTGKGTDADATERVMRVAAIVGACTVCLGDDPLCTECRGHGKPGSREPDPEALVEWIDLPLRRAGLCVTALRPVRPDHNPRGETQ